VAKEGKGGRQRRVERKNKAFATKKKTDKNMSISIGRAPGPGMIGGKRETRRAKVIRRTTTISSGSVAVHFPSARAKKPKKKRRRKQGGRRRLKRSLQRVRQGPAADVCSKNGQSGPGYAKGG